LKQKLSSALEVLGAVIITTAVYFDHGIAAAGYVAGGLAILFGVALSGPLRRGRR